MVLIFIYFNSEVDKHFRKVKMYIYTEETLHSKSEYNSPIKGQEVNL